MDGIAETASLFQQEIGGAPATRGGRGNDEGGRAPVEQVFGNLGNLDGDSGTAGGDTPDRGVRYKTDAKGDILLDDNGDPIPIKKARKPEPEEEEEEDDTLDVDPDADPEGEEGEEEDPDADPDGDDDADPVLKKKFAVTVDGEELEVTVGEGLRGYIRNETFHRRLNSLNEFKTGLEAERDKLVTDRTALAERINTHVKELEAVLPPEPNWDELFQKNPTQARELQKQYDGLKNKLAAHRETQAKLLNEARELQAKKDAEFADREFATFVNKVGWKNEKEADAGLKAMRAAAKALGFPDELINATSDSRMLMALHKVARYDAIVANKPRLVRAKSETKTNGGLPGSKQRRTSPTGGGARTQEPLRNNGKTAIEHAADAFLREINPRSRRRG